MTLSWPHRRDDRGSIAIALMVMTAGVGLSAVMVMSGLQVVSGARTEQFRAYALQAARAGLTSALTSIRSALDSQLQGSVLKLPCGTYVPMTTDIVPQITGSIGVPGGTATTNPGYQASVKYFTEDPTGQNDTWLRQHGNPCVSSSAPWLPNFAYISSVGTYGADPARRATRTLSGVYTFRTALNANTGGGQIRLSSSSTLCLDAGAMTAGTKLTIRTCASTTPVPDRQRFAYQPGLEMTVGTDTDQLCVNAPASGQPITVETCATRAASAAPQRWSFNSATAFVATVGSANVCWSRPSNTAGALVLGSTDSTTCNTAASSGWSLDRNVGAGGAGRLIPKSQLPSQVQAFDLHASQLVSYAEPSQCLAFTTGTWAVKVAQCKQSLVFDLAHNYDQSWASPKDGDSGPVFAYDYDYNYGAGAIVCLTLPAAGSSSTALTLTACNPFASAPAANQTWWSRGVSTTAANLRYRLEGIGSWAGKCLTLVTDAVGNRTPGLAPCDNSIPAKLQAQQWNAAAVSSPTGLTSIGEK